MPFIYIRLRLLQIILLKKITAVTRIQTGGAHGGGKIEKNLMFFFSFFFTFFIDVSSET